MGGPAGEEWDAVVDGAVECGDFGVCFFLFIYLSHEIGGNECANCDNRFEHDDLAEPAILLGRRTGR